MAPRISSTIPITRLFILSNVTSHIIYSLEHLHFAIINIIIDNSFSKLGMIYISRCSSQLIDKLLYQLLGVIMFTL